MNEVFWCRYVLKACFNIHCWKVLKNKSEEKGKKEIYFFLATLLSSSAFREVTSEHKLQLEMQKKLYIL